MICDVSREWYHRLESYATFCNCRNLLHSGCLMFVSNLKHIAKEKKNHRRGWIQENPIRFMGTVIIFSLIGSRGPYGLWAPRAILQENKHLLLFVTYCLFFWWDLPMPLKKVELLQGKPSREKNIFPLHVKGFLYVRFFLFVPGDCCFVYFMKVKFFWSSAVASHY